MSNPSFHALVTEIRTCHICAAELPLGPRPVIQVNPAAKILIAGQAPGRKVHETGLPFNDASGDRLRDWMGVGRETFYDAHRIAIVPMGFCYPGTGKSGDLPPRTECALHWRKSLMERLEAVQFTLVIGQYAMDWHLGERRKKTVTANVEAWKEFWPDKIVLPHPSPRNNRWLRNNPWFEEDVLPHLKKRIQDLI